MSADPLDGLRVLDLSRLLPGPYCSLLLADFGADVVKVEDTRGGDPVRRSEPALGGGDGPSAFHVALNRNKRSLAIDLKAAAGRAALLRLAETADVILESFRPGVMERLGLDYPTLAARNPRLVYCALTGYGQTGPLRERAGHDLNYIGRSGVLALTGEPGGAPVQPGVQVADLGGGALMAATGILLALQERERSGRGQSVDVSMLDGSLAWLALIAGRVFAGEEPTRGRERLSGAIACYRPYRCADGWVTLGALEPRFWRAWCDGVGRPDLFEAQFAAPGSAAHGEIEAIFATRTRAEWSAFGARHDCCLDPMLEPAEALESAQVRAREMVVSFVQSEVGWVRGLGPPVKLGRTPGAIGRGAPRLGEHTAEVLAEAGYGAAEVDALAATGVVGIDARRDAVASGRAEGGTR